MSKTKRRVMLGALALVLTTGTACLRLFAGSSTPAAEAEIQQCAGLSGPVRIDCEARYRKP